MSMKLSIQEQLQRLEESTEARIKSRARKREQHALEENPMYRKGKGMGDFGGKGVGDGGGKGKGGGGGGGGGVCYAFQKGECSYGSSCRFAHVIDSGEGGGKGKGKGKDGKGKKGKPPRPTDPEAPIAERRISDADTAQVLHAQRSPSPDPSPSPSPSPSRRTTRSEATGWRRGCSGRPCSSAACPRSPGRSTTPGRPR